MGIKAGSYKRIFLLTLVICFIAVLGVCDLFIPNTATSGALGKNGNIGGIIMLKEDSDTSATATLFGLPLKSVALCPVKDGEVYLGGDALGVKFHTGGVMVVGISDGSCAQKAGLKKGDFITSADGIKTDSVEKLHELISESAGKRLELSYERDGKSRTALLSPTPVGEGIYKAGMWIRDSTAGIGTVTFVTKDGIFASLGHGISDADTGRLMPLARGTAVRISVDQAVKGKPNAPGELKGSFSAERVGALVRNLPTGLYGVMDSSELKDRALVTLGDKNDVHTGKAQIVASVDSEGKKYYDAEIIQLVKGSEDGKNFVIEISDEELIEKTGGIVQGMSGSPVIQDGKLVGAVTHVFINDPTRGYGIFIENMLNGANIPTAKAS